MSFKNETTSNNNLLSYVRCCHFNLLSYYCYERMSPRKTKLEFRVEVSSTMHNCSFSNFFEDLVYSMENDEISL